MVKVYEGTFNRDVVAVKILINKKKGQPLSNTQIETIENELLLIHSFIHSFIWPVKVDLFIMTLLFHACKHYLFL